MMGSAEFGRRWTVRVCGALVLLVVLACTTIVGERRTELRGGKELPALSNNLSRDQALVVAQAVTSRDGSVMNFEPERGVIESYIHSTTGYQVVVSTKETTPSLESVSPSLQDTGTEQRPAPKKLKTKFTPLTSSEIDELGVFVIFVGFARSGHSIVGSLLDAHPDVIIAHEYNVLKDIKGSEKSKGDVLSLVNRLYKNSHDSAVSGWRSKNKGQKGYKLGISGSWQGRIRRLRVVGDKAAGKTAREHMRDTTRCPKLLKLMNTTLGAAVKAIRVLRNPYDIITTRVLYNKLKMNEIANVRNSSTTHKYKQPAELAKQTERFLELTSQVNKMITQCNIPVYNVHLADLIHQPRSVMKDLCEIVQVECHSDYLDLCEEKVFKTLSKTRNLVQWSQKQIETVAQRIIRVYPEFSRYSYDCDC